MLSPFTGYIASSTVLYHLGSLFRRRLIVKNASHFRLLPIPYDLDGDIKQAILLSWLEGDSEDPQNWTPKKKATIVLVTSLNFTFIAANMTSVAALAVQGATRFEVTEEHFLLSLTVFTTALALASMAAAPFSETFGRSTVYHCSAFLNVMLFLPQIFTSSLSGLLVARTAQGAAAGGINAMVAGTVADLYVPAHRGPPLTLLAFMVFLGQGFGGTIFGYVGSHLGLSWSYGILAALATFAGLLNIVFLHETRSDIILSRHSARLRFETGEMYGCCMRDLQPSIGLAHRGVALLKPFRLLLTDPNVATVSVWAGFTWACIFLSGVASSVLFRAYGFSQAELGLLQLTLPIGALLGTISNRHQDHLYACAVARHSGKAKPEFRLYYSMIGAVFFATSTFGTAWTARVGIPWPLPAAFMVLGNWGIFAVYTGIFNYLADSYERESSSAQAAQSFTRNLASGLLPLVGSRLYTAIPISIASSIIGSIALVLSLVPFVLYRCGQPLRRKHGQDVTVRP